MILFIFVIMCVCSTSANALSSNRFHSISTIEDIPIDEQIEIKTLFKDLFFNDVFSYSLFGDKPLSISRAIINNNSREKLLELLSLDGYCFNMLEHCCEPSTILKKKWEIWCKHKTRFQLKNYFFFQKKIGSQSRLFLINKTAFLNVVNQNLALFQHVIGPHLSAEKLLEETKKEGTNIFDVLHDNEGLLGILLGFGKHNSMLFQERESFISSSYKNLLKQEIIDDKIKDLNKKLKAFHSHDSCIISTINRVGFSSDPHHSETMQLKNKYDALNRKMNEIYSKDDWFEQTLIQLTSD